MDHNMALEESLVVIIFPSPGMIGRAWGLAVIGLEFFSQWRVLCKRNRVGRAGFGAVNPPVGSIDILTADGHNSPCNTRESIHDFTGILLDHRNHLQYHIMGEALEIPCIRGKPTSTIHNFLHS